MKECVHVEMFEMRESNGEELSSLTDSIHCQCVDMIMFSKVLSK